MRFTVLALVSAALLSGQASDTARQQPARRRVDWVDLGYYKQVTPERWRSRVDQMLQRDAQNPPPKDGVMFVGSATIAEWDLKHYGSERESVKPVILRGFLDNEEFGLKGSHALGFEKEVAKIPVSTAAA